MKMLIKNNIRQLFKNKLFLLLLVGLALLLGFLFTYLYYGNVPMKTNYERELKETNVEEFRIWPTIKLTDEEIDLIKKDLIKSNPEIDLLKISEQSIDTIIEEYKIDLTVYTEKRINILSDAYDFNYELFERKYIEENSNTLYVTPNKGEINEYILCEGTDKLKNNQILISVQFAKKNNIEVGDFYRIKDKEYKVIGTYYQPAETLIYNSNYTSSMNTVSNCGVIMTLDSFNELSNDKEAIYIAKFNESYSEDEKREKINEMMSDDKVFSLVRSDNLPNFTAMNNNFNTSLTLMYSGILIFLISIILVILQIIKNHFEHTKKYIGLLKAIGYKNVTIFIPYLIINIPLVIGMVFGMFMGYLASDSFMKSGLNIFNYIVVKENFNYWLALIVIICLLFIISTIILIKFIFLLKVDALNLIKNIKSDSINPLVMFSKAITRKLNFIARVEIIFVISNLSRFIVIVIVSLLAFIMANFAGSIYGLINKPIEDLTRQLNYNYCYSYKEVKEKDTSSKDYDYVLSSNIYFIKDEDNNEINHYFTCLFIDENFHSIILKDKNNSDLLEGLTGNNIIISRKMANDFNLEKGDILIIKGNENKDLEFLVHGINSTSYDSNVYINKDYIKEFNYNYSLNSYNQVYTVDDLISDEDATLITKMQKIGQIQNQLNASLSMIPILAIVTILIVFSMSCFIAYLNINDNKKSIALLQLIGYKENQIQKMIINIYSIAIVIGSVLGGISINYIFQTIGNMVNKSTEVFIKLDVSIMYKLFCVLVIYIIYKVSTVLMYGRVKNMELNVVMYEHN